MAERHESDTSHTDSVRLELETDAGTTAVEGAVVLDQPRLLQIDDIYCEAPAGWQSETLKNEDVPGVIGDAFGTQCLGRKG